MRQYYSERNKIISSKRIDIEVFKKLLLHIYSSFYKKHYFFDSIGFNCVDFFASTHGKLGDDATINYRLILETGKDNLWPLESNINSFTIDDCFDIIEFLHDHVSKPENGSDYHSWDGCGYHHYGKFNREIGQAEFREEINKILCRYEDGYVLDKNGDILHQVEPLYVKLFEAELPSSDKENITDRLEHAKSKFLSRNINDRRLALKDLGDILEYLRKEAKVYLLKQDENDLFNILNNFGIRHHNKDQQTEYDKPIFYSWMFYYFLASIHALQRLINRR